MFPFWFFFLEKDENTVQSGGWLVGICNKRGEEKDQKIQRQKDRYYRNKETDTSRDAPTHKQAVVTYIISYSISPGPYE